MSDNPNPTTCGKCGTDNPPGQQFCINCHAPLTIVADASLLDGTPESPDELRSIESDHADDQPEMVVMGGMGGAPMFIPEESIEDEADVPPRD